MFVEPPFSRGSHIIFPNPDRDNSRIAAQTRTSSCRTAVLNMGHSPRVFPLSARDKEEPIDAGRAGWVHSCDNHPSGGILVGKENVGKAVEVMSRPADGEELHRRREIAVDDGHVSGKKPLAIYVAKRRARKRRQNRVSQDGDGSVGHSGGAVQKHLTRIMDNGSKDDKSPRHSDRLARECLPSQE